MSVEIDSYNISKNKRNISWKTILKLNHEIVNLIVFTITDSTFLNLIGIILSNISFAN